MLTVVVAVDLPGTGEPGVGTLDAAVGAGAVLGSPAASLLVGTRALDAWFALGVTLCGLPVTLVGAVTAEAAALVLLTCVGVGDALIDVGRFTLLGRTAPDDVLARVFGVLESPVALATGTGAIVAALVVDTAGVRTALVAVGLLCPVAAAAAWPRLRRLDRSIGVRDRDIGLLRGTAALRVLPLPSVEQLARRLEPLTVPGAEPRARRGEHLTAPGAGDRRRPRVRPGRDRGRRGLPLPPRRPGDRRGGPHGHHASRRRDAPRVPPRAALRRDRPVPVQGCTQAGNLTLTFVAHVGEVASQAIRQRRKLVGIDVIHVHRMLENPVRVPEHVLLSEALHRSGGDDRPDPAHEIPQDLEGIGATLAWFVDVGDLAGSLPEPPAPSLRERLGRTFAVAGSGVPYVLGLRRGRRTSAA